MAEMDYWFSDMHTGNVKISIRLSRQLFSGTSEFQRIDVFDSPEFGKFLTSDGNIIFSEKDEFTYDEMEWLINWCVVRGQNLFVPHAFYYSIRGPRWEERPPDVGPNSPWWGEYKIFADYCARLSWLNTDSETVAPTAILVDSDRATTYGVRPLFENQLDFNYLEFRALIEDSEVTDEGLLVKAKSQDVVQKTILYKTLVVTPNGTPPDSCDDKLHALAEKGRVLYLGSSTQLPPNAKQARNDAEEVVQ